jgi:hypothetical protein
VNVGYVPPFPAALVDHVYFENEPGRRSSAKLLRLDEAFLIAVNIAKLPSVPRQILKDQSAAAQFGKPGRLSARVRSFATAIQPLQSCRWPQL